MVPSTPPSFVKFKASGFSINNRSIRLYSHQMTKYRYLDKQNYGPMAGTAATAEAVSCPATAITGIAPKPSDRLYFL